MRLINLSGSLRGTDFEHKLKVKRSPAKASLAMPLMERQSFFTESLILAQDERWRRA
jgi:hypothetical protein